MKATNKYFISTLFYVLCLVCSSYAQSSRFSYEIIQPKPLKVVIDDLKIKHGLEFSFPSELIENHHINTSTHHADNLSQLIKSILHSTEIEFIIIDNYKILLRPKRNKETNSGDEIITISGSIYDENGDPLSYVDVILDTLFIGSSSDDNGYFEFSAPKEFSNRNISFHLVGHKELIKSIQENQLNPKTELSSSVIRIEEILLVQKIKDIELQPTNLSATIQSDYLNKIITAPILSNDIVRSLQMTAGIDATNDLDASIRIRGSQGDETLLIVDGIPIYKAEHFYGIFGSMNGNHINSVTLHKNSQPIEFGGKSGGLVRMRSKDYFNKVSAGIDLNMLTSALTLSAPIGQKWGFILSGRTTYDNAADSKIFNWIEPSPEENIVNGFVEDRPLLLNTSPIIRFYDLNSKLIFRPSERHLISLSAFKSQDNFNNEYDISFSSPRVNGTIEGREIMDDQESWSNFGLALQHSIELNKGWKINSRIYNSIFDYTGALKTSLFLQQSGVDQLKFLDNQKENKIVDWGFHSIASKKIKNDQLSIGISGVDHNINFKFQADTSRTFDLSDSGWESALFASYGWAMTDNWNINIGGRLNYYSKTDKTYFAPRISSYYKLSNHVTLKAAYAQHYQFLREITFYSRLREPLDVFLLTTDGKKNRKYPVGSSVNSMIGVSLVKDTWSLDIEAYNKELQGVVEHTQVIVGQNQNDIVSPNRDNKAIIGNGRTFGVDLSIGYQDRSLTSSIAYTLSKSTNQFEELFRNQSIPSENDRRHQLKWVNTFDLGKWLITGNYIFASGRSQLNLFDREEAVNLSEIQADQSFTRLDPYHRVDLGVSYSFTVQNKKASIGFSVLNLTNNVNVDYIQYLFAIPTRRGTTNRNILTGTTTQLLDRTFNLTVKVDL